MKKSSNTTLEKLMAQRKAIDTKIARINEVNKAEKRAAVLKVIEATGLAELEDAQLRKALAELRAAHASKKKVQPELADDQKTAP
jgi:ribosomal protein L14E/L6E/L27E